MSKLVHPEGRILVKVNTDGKMWHSFADGTQLRIERDVNNLDNAYVKQTIGLCISGKDIPEGSYVLYHFNSVHDTNRIFNHSQLSGSDVASQIDIYSIPETECFLWRLPTDTEWKPIGNYALALKVFRPYKGVLQNIDPTEIKDVLYVLTGDYAGNVFHVVKAASYRLIFRDPDTGRDKEYIRIRPDGDEKSGREPELIAVRNDLTEQLLNGDLLIGIDKNNAKPLKEVK